MAELRVSCDVRISFCCCMLLIHELAYNFPKALERLEELKRGGKNTRAASGRLTRKDQKRDEAECAVM